jgi:hypothetical protein
MCNPDLICPNIIFKVSNMLSKHVHIFYMTILIIIVALRYSQFYGNANWNEHYICMFSDRTVFVRRDHYLYVLRGHDCCPVVVSLNGQYIFMFSAKLLFSPVFFFTLTWLNTRLACFKRTCRWLSCLKFTLTEMIHNIHASSKLLFTVVPPQSMREITPGLQTVISR